MSVGLSGVPGTADEATKQPLTSGEPVIITAKPKFERQDPFIHLIISDTKRTYSVPWSTQGGTPFTRVSLDTNRVYTFTVDKESSGASAGTKLLRIEADGRTIHDVETCEVHKVKMELKQVRVVYGRIVRGPDEPSPDWEHWSFPQRGPNAERRSRPGIGLELIMAVISIQD